MNIVAKVKKVVGEKKKKIALGYIHVRAR